MNNCNHFWTNSSGGSRISPGGRQHTILPNFPKKLHEIERIWAPLNPPLNSSAAFKSSLFDVPPPPPPTRRQLRFFHFHGIFLVKLPNNSIAPLLPQRPRNHWFTTKIKCYCIQVIRVVPKQKPRLQRANRCKKIARCNWTLCLWWHWFWN